MIAYIGSNYFMISTLKNDRLIKALLRQPVDRTPIWIMRQAGRYLPEYRATRAKAGNFLTLCQTPELACEVTLQPLARYALDAAILFSDILTIPDAMGLGLYFKEGTGPGFERPIANSADIDKLSEIAIVDELQYVADAVGLIKRELQDKVPLIGFSGSPWTLACYMVEGQASKTFSKIRAMIYQAPTLLHQLLAILTKAVIAYCQMQIAAGVDVVMLFDTWGGLLTTPAYQQFSLCYMQQIITALRQLQTHSPVPCIIFTKNSAPWLEDIAQSGCQGVGVDWTIDIAEVRHRIGNSVAIQGNLDPAVLYGHPDRIKAEVKKLLTAFGSHPGHIVNLGHGIEKDTPADNVKVLVEAVHEYSFLEKHV